VTQPAKPKPRRRLTREVAGVFSARALFSLLGMLSGIILARWLGPHDRGILAMVLLLPATAVSFAKLGISPANVFFINRHGVSSTRAASNSAGIAAITGAIILLAVWILREPIMTRWLPGLPPWALAIAALRIPLRILDNYLYGVLQAEGLFSIYNTRLVRGETIRFLLIVGALVFLGFGLFAAVVIYTLMTFINVGWLIYTVRRQIPFTVRIDRKLTASQLRFGIKSYLQILAQHLLLRISMFMVASFLGAVQLAFYSIAVRLTELIIEIPQAVGLVLYPRLASLPEERMHRVTAQACRRTLMMTTLAALGLVPVGRFLIHLWYGAPYAPAGEPLPWLAVGVLAMSVFVILTRDFTSRDRQQVNIAVGLIALTINIGLNVVLIPLHGIVGAAVSTAVSYTTASAVLMAVFLRTSGMRASEALVPTREDFVFFVETARRVAAHSVAVLQRGRHWGKGKNEGDQT